MLVEDISWLAEGVLPDTVEKITTVAIVSVIARPKGVAVGKPKTDVLGDATNFFEVRQAILLRTAQTNCPISELRIALYHIKKLIDAYPSKPKRSKRHAK